MKKLILSFFVLCLSSIVFSQNNITFSFNHMLNNQPFALDQGAIVDGDYEVKMSRLEYYISEISITHDGGNVTDLENIYLLVQPNNESVYDLGSWNINSIESVQFGFGVDPEVNTADPAQWPNDHPLSFQNPSMHWGWASGYRFLAVEGTAGENFLNTFEIHALGDNNYGMVNLSYDDLLEVDGNLAIGISADYTKIFTGVDVEEGDIVHSTSLPKAINSLNNCKTLVFTPSEVVSGLDDLISTNDFVISPNPIQNGQLKFRLAKMNHSNIAVNIYDAIGKLVQSDNVIGSIVSLDLSELQKGIYFLQLSDTNGSVVTKRFMK